MINDRRVMNIYRLKTAPEVIHIIAHKTLKDANRKRLVNNEDWRWVAVQPIHWVEPNQLDEEDDSQDA